MKKNIAFFDFDGTLISDDSLYILLRANHSFMRLVWTVACHIHSIIFVLVGVHDKSKLKEILFGSLYRGVKYEDFKLHCMKIQEILVSLEHKNVMTELKKRIAEGYEVVIVTASMSEWVRPWAERSGDIRVISTAPEVREGVLTGYFGTKNCNGIEKKRRILSEYDISVYDKVLGYGNSKGDYDMFSLVTESFLVKKGEITLLKN